MRKTTTSALWALLLTGIVSVACADCGAGTAPTAGAFVVIGHRGNPVAAPENTLASVAAAFAIGCDFVEVDVRLTSDRVAVVIHDETVDRTTNGHGSVADLTLAELKALDAGSWKDRRFAGERIPTLAEVLSAAKGKGRLLLDVPVDGMGPIIADVFHSLNLPFRDGVIATWSPEQRLDMKQNVPGATIVKADDAPDRWDADYFVGQRAAGVTMFDIGNWSPIFQADARRHQMLVWAWTVNDEAMMRQLIRQGADGFETDNPELGIRVARELGVRR